MRTNGCIPLAALNIFSTDSAGKIRGVNNTGNPGTANSYVVTYLTGPAARSRRPSAG